MKPLTGKIWDVEEKLYNFSKDIFEFYLIFDLVERVPDWNLDADQLRAELNEIPS